MTSALQKLLSSFKKETDRAREEQREKEGEEEEEREILPQVLRFSFLKKTRPSSWKSDSRKTWLFSRKRRIFASNLDPTGPVVVLIPSPHKSQCENKSKLRISANFGKTSEISANEQLKTWRGIPESQIHAFFLSIQRKLGTFRREIRSEIWHFPHLSAGAKRWTFNS